jgi:K+ transporter
MNFLAFSHAPPPLFRRVAMELAGAVALAFLTVDLVFLTANVLKIPHGRWFPLVVAGAVVHNLTHNKVLHEQVIFLTVLTEDLPFVPAAARVEVRSLGDGLYSAVARYGFMEHPSGARALDTRPS